jgi:type III pantothenate kinase
MACIVIDVGNTSTSLALARGGRVWNARRTPSHGVDLLERAGRELAALAAAAQPEGAVLCSVVPAASGVWRRALRAAGVRPVVEVTHRIRLGVSVRYPRPETIGADRLANACEAVHAHGAPVIVADFGTALTFDVVDASGAYVGGVIAPGLPLMTDYLYEKTALLPRVTLKAASTAFGRSTTAAIRIGARVGYRGMVREIVTHLRQDPEVAGAALCATGGYARWALHGLDMPFRIDPLLTLRGLGRLFDLNAGET